MKKNSLTYVPFYSRTYFDYKVLNTPHYINIDMSSFNISNYIYDGCVFVGNNNNIDDCVYIKNDILKGSVTINNVDYKGNYLCQCDLTINGSSIALYAQMSRTDLDNLIFFNKDRIIVDISKYYVNDTGYRYIDFKRNHLYIDHCKDNLPRVKQYTRLNNKYQTNSYCSFSIVDPSVSWTFVKKGTSLFIKGYI